MTSTTNGSVWHRHPLIVTAIVAVVTAGISWGAWKSVASWQISTLQTAVDEHVERQSHEGASTRITVLETRFGYIQRELSEIKTLLQRRADNPNN